MGLPGSEDVQFDDEYVMFPQLAPSVDCDGSAVSLMSAASLWAALC